MLGIKRLMKEVKKSYQIKGMHCHSCELLIEDELMKISCVKQAVVSQKKGIAEIYFTNHFLLKKFYRVKRNNI